MSAVDVFEDWPTNRAGCSTYVCACQRCILHFRRNNIHYRFIPLSAQLTGKFQCYRDRRTRYRHGITGFVLPATIAVTGTPECVTADVLTANENLFGNR